MRTPWRVSHRFRTSIVNTKYPHGDGHWTAARSEKHLIHRVQDQLKAMRSITHHPHPYPVILSKRSSTFFTHDHPGEVSNSPCLDAHPDAELTVNDGASRVHITREADHTHLRVWRHMSVWRHISLMKLHIENTLTRVPRGLFGRNGGTFCTTSYQGRYSLNE